jgi:threonine dehydrogenase-like Zn-dependent dehydrogenase
MKAVTYVDIDQIELSDVPKPEIQEPGDAILKVTTAAICGSDLHVLNGRIPGMLPGSIIGHEFMGVVDEVGGDVTKVQPGQRVLSSMMIPCGECYLCLKGEGGKCSNLRVFGYGSFFGDLNGGQTEYVRVPQANRILHPIDDGLTDEQVLFAGDILTTGFTAAKEAHIQEGDVVAVIGCGPVGLFAIQAAQTYKPSQVFAIDSVEQRLEMAQGFGATPIKLGEQHPTMAVQNATEGAGADAVIECVGGGDPLTSALELVRPGGRVSVVGVSSIEDFTMNLGLTFVRGIDIKFVGTCDVPGNWEPVLGLIKSGDLQPEAIISHTLPLDQAMRGYELFKAREAMKVVLKP